jgi:hypothetical protein
MRVGTKSVLFGAHCFFIHPWFVAVGWWKLFGFPRDPRLWLAFFVHDLGYWGKPNMDGPEGERHPEFGARVMGRLFGLKWAQLCLYHSRYYAKANNAHHSQLCFADKLAFAMTPRWIYLPMTTATGEIREYMRNAQKADSAHWIPTGDDKRAWHAQLCAYMTGWVIAHITGAKDTWTAARHGATVR